MFDTNVVKIVEAGYFDKAIEVIFIFSLYFKNTRLVRFLQNKVSEELNVCKNCSFTCAYIKSCKG